MHPLLIDSNERGSLPDAIERRCESMRPTIPTKRQRLIVGDYICGEICVEAKTIADFIESMRNGHLWRQLDNMDANYERFFLVIHGSIAKYVAFAKKQGRFLTHSRVQNELTGLLLVSWLILNVRCSSLQTLARLLCSSLNYTISYTSQQVSMVLMLFVEYLQTMYG